jgi:hypothetical protein
MGDDKLQHLNAAIRGFAQDDYDAVRDAFTDNAVLHAAGKGPLSGDYHGPDEMITRFFRRGKEMCGGNLTLEPVSILPGNDYVMMFLRVRGERNGRTLDILCAEAAKLADDGRIDEFWYLANDQAAEDSFYAD